jgi:hypothetical protein
LKIYARVEYHKVVEIIQPLLNDEGIDIPIKLRFIPEFVETLVDMTSEIPIPKEGWNWVEGKFSKNNL